MISFYSNLEIIGIKYKKLAEDEKKVIFGGHLGEHKYYDIDAVIVSTPGLCERKLK